MVTLTVTAVFILSTLGLFDFSIVQVPNSNQCQLAETGSSQRQLSKLDATGEISILTPGSAQLVLHRHQDGVNYYMKVDGNDDNRLTFTADPNEKSTFTSRIREDNIYDVFYVEPSTNNRLCLQGVFPSVNGTVDYTQAYARVGDCSDHINIRGNVVPLSAISINNEMAC